MQLVRPDLFDPEATNLSSWSYFPKVMIRNNKATVTDLQGQRLFKPVSVHSREYGYSEAEAHFYRTLSEFIMDGRAYAGDSGGPRADRANARAHHPAKAGRQLDRGDPQRAVQAARDAVGHRQRVRRR